VYVKSSVLEQGAVLVDAPGTSTKLMLSHEILTNVGFGDDSVRSANKYLVVSMNGHAPIGTTDMVTLLWDCTYAAPDGAQAVTMVITHPDVRSLFRPDPTVC
jgi:hypothetical protein